MHMKLNRLCHDRRMANALVRGDEDTWKTLFQHYSQQLFGFFFSCLGERGTAQDLVQETFVSAVRSMENYRLAKGTIEQWLWGIARRRLADGLRTRYRENKVRAFDADGEELLQQADSGPAPDETLARSDTRLQVGAALATLSEVHQLVLTEKYLNRLPTEAVAQKVGRSLKATESLLTRARNELRTKMESLFLETEKGGAAI